MVMRHCNLYWFTLFDLIILITLRLSVHPYPPYSVIWPMIIGLA